jgi:predicted MPP superfamily phosphohydrolase
MFQTKGAIILILICLLAQTASFRLFWSRSGNRIYRAAVALLFAAFNILWLFSFYRLFNRMPVTGWFLTLAARPAIAWQSVHLLAVLPLALATYIVYYLARLFAFAARKLGRKRPAPPQGDDGRRGFLKAAGAFGLGGILAFSAYAVLRQSDPPSARRHSLKIPGLPPGLHGFTIAHITDIHLGLWSDKRELDQCLLEASRLKPDLVVFTGDMVDRDPEAARLYAEPVQRRFRGVPFGVYGVLGNHDHFYDPDRIAGFLEASGIRMLRDERVTVAGLPLSITGLDDQSASGHSFRRRGQAGEDSLGVLDFNRVRGPALRDADFRLLLNHRPEGFRQAALAGYGLYLVGHTHEIGRASCRERV